MATIDSLRYVLLDNKLELKNMIESSEPMNKKVVEKLDHKNLNLDVPFLKGKMASTEILCIAIWNEIDQDIKNLGAELHSLKLTETENNFVEYFGPNHKF